MKSVLKSQKRNKFAVAGNHEYQETDDINSVQSSLQVSSFISGVSHFTIKTGVFSIASSQSNIIYDVNYLFIKVLKLIYTQEFKVNRTLQTFCRPGYKDFIVSRHLFFNAFQHHTDLTVRSYAI